MVIGEGVIAPVCVRVTCTVEIEAGTTVNWGARGQTGVRPAALEKFAEVAALLADHVFFAQAWQ